MTDNAKSPILSKNVSSSIGLEPPLRFPGFEDAWERKKLEKICSINPSSGKLPAEFYYIDLECVVNGEIVSQLNVISRANAPSRAQRVLSPDDVLYQTVRPYQKNNFFFKQMLDLPAVASTGYAQIRGLDCSIKFIYHLLHTDKFVLEAMKRSTGTSYPAISSNDLAEIDVCYPTRTEQQKIADFLSLVDERIEKQRQLVEVLKRYKRGLFLSLYNNSQKSTFLFEDIYVKAAEGGTPSTTDSSYYIDGNIPFAKIEDLNSQYLNSTNCYITEKGLKSSSAWIVPIDSILFSNGATIGSCSINKIPTSTKQGILGIVPKENYSVEFLYFLFTSWIFIKKVKAITTKGTMDCAYLKDINKITLDIPDMYTQLKIQRIMNFFERGIEKQVKTLNFLIHQKNGLLQQMFI